MHIDKNMIFLDATKHPSCIYKILQKKSELESIFTLL